MDIQTAVPASLEQDLVGAILADPSLYESVSYLTPRMFVTPLAREIWRVIQASGGRVAPSALHADLISTPEGRAALEDAGGPDVLHQVAATGLTAGDVTLLAEKIAARYVRQRVKEIIVQEHQAPDPDVAGWVRRLADRIASAASVIAPNHTAGALSRGAHAVAEDVEWRQAHPGKVRGLRTNFGAHEGKLGAFDRATDGLHPGELTLITGQTGGGKSMLLCNMALSLALTERDTDRRPNHVAFFSLEMNERALAKRWVASLARFPLDAPVLPDNARQKISEAVQLLARLEAERRLTVITPSAVSTVEQIVQYLRRLRAEDACDVAFIDYAQIVRTSTMATASKYEQLAHISMLLKVEAEALGIPVILAAQLTRPDRDIAWRPSLADVADSYALVRNSDNVHHIWFPADQLPSRRAGIWHNIAVLLTDKIRNRERPGPLYYHAERTFCQFVDCLPQIVIQLESEECQEILRERTRRAGTR
jgi:replicative DNA helicase